MGSIWLLIVTIVSVTNGGDVTVKNEVHWPNDPSYNTEQLCNAAGRVMSDKIQLNVGTEGVVFWSCQEAGLDAMIKGAGKAAPTANGQAL